MNNRLTLFLVILGVLITGQLSAQYSGEIMLTDLNFLGSGARARAMGGAFMGVSDDASALSWNPAGLMQVMTPQVSFAMDYFGPTAKYDLSYANNSNRDAVDELSADRYPLSFASFTSPLRVKGKPIVASVMYSSVAYDLDNFMLNIDDNLELDDTELDTAFNYLENYDSRLNKFRLGFGTNVWKYLNFGAAIDIYWGSAHYDERMSYSFSFLDPDEGHPVVIDYVRGVADTIDFSGMNFVGSFMWDDDKYNLGLVIKTPFYLSQEHVQHTNDTIWENDLIRVDPGLIDELQKEKIKVPLGIGVGGSYNVNENFLLAGDFEWRRYGSSDIRFHYDSVLSNGEVEENYFESSLPTKNAYAIRMGAEYKFDLSWATVPVRAGFRYETFGWLQEEDIRYELGSEATEDQDSIYNYYSGSDQLTGYTLSLGTGFEWELIKLGFAFEYEARDKDLSGTDAYGPFEATSEYRGPRLIVNFTGLFK